MTIANGMRKTPTLKTRPLKYKESPDAWQTKIHMLISFPFPLPWMLIAGFLFAVGYIILFIAFEVILPEGKVDRHLLQTLFQDLFRDFAVRCVLIAAIANSVVYFEKLLDDVAEAFPLLLDESEEDSQEWIKKWYRWMFWSSRNIIMGLVLGDLCLMTWFYGGGHTKFIYMPDHMHSALLVVLMAYSALLVFCVGFLGGAMLWTMLGVAGLTSSLGRDVKIRPSIFDTKISVLRTASSVLWKISLTATFVYLFGIANLFLSGRVLSITEMILPCAAGLFIIFYFIFPQRNIHTVLSDMKRSKLKTLVDTIDKTFDRVSANPTPQDIKDLRELFDLQTIVSRKKSWTFGIGELLTLGGSILVPLALCILNYFLKK